LPGGDTARSTVAIQHACNVHAHGIATRRICANREFRSQFNRTETTTDAEYAFNGVCPGRALRRGIPERRP
jgi:hypothetical protein